MTLVFGSSGVAFGQDDPAVVADAPAFTDPEIICPEFEFCGDESVDLPGQSEHAALKAEAQAKAGDVV